MKDETIHNATDSQPDTKDSASDVDGTDKRAYDVGYGKPPVATRFRKGRCPNPKGRKKKPVVEDMRTVVEQFFDEPMKVREGDQTRTLTKIEAIIRMRCNKALQGNARAAMSLFRQAQKTGQFTKASPKSGITIVPPGTPEEQGFLRVFHATNDCHREGPSADEACGFLPGDISNKGGDRA